MIAGIDHTGIAVAFICHDGDGNILLAKRSKHTRDQHGHWEAGGGKIEHLETIEEALHREIKEEYDIDDPVIDHVLPAVDYFDNQGGVKSHWIILFHIVKVNPAKVKNNEPRSIEEIGWFQLDNLPSPLHAGFAKDLEVFSEEFRKYIDKK